MPGARRSQQAFLQGPHGSRRNSAIRDTPRPVGSARNHVAVVVDRIACRPSPVICNRMRVGRVIPRGLFLRFWAQAYISASIYFPGAKSGRPSEAASRLSVSRGHRLSRERKDLSDCGRQRDERWAAGPVANRARSHSRSCWRHRRTSCGWLDTTIVNVVLPALYRPRTNPASWVLTSYIVAAVIMMPLTGRLAAPLA